MKIDFWFPSEPVTNQAVAEFERLIGGKLPDDYRQFMIEANGGSKPKIENFTVLETSEWTMLAELYSISGLTDEFSAFQNELPRDLISIGNDIGGNKLCLCIKGENTGKIYFYDHEKRPLNGRAAWSQFALCSKSFEGFLGSLK